MKTNILVVTAILMSFYQLTGCTQSVEEQINNDDIENAEQVGNADSRLCQSVDMTIQGENPNEEEVLALQFIREEEKLARDVYISLYDQWGLRPFGNISKSEQVHMDAILTLLKRYEIEDPVADNGPGVFKNKELQELYDQLMVQGSESVIQALNVGALIEETDILDIQVMLDETIEKEDLTTVLNNLKRGSENHLRAYVRNLQRYNIVYEPKLLAEDVYLDIID
jgi:hypothetical protein